MEAHRRTVIVAVIAATGVLVAACGSSETRRPAAAPDLPQGAEPVELDPSAFTTRIDNPYWPMRPGSRWVYREVDDDGSVQRVVVTVTNRTKRIANGITARVVRDVVTEDGEAVEVTDDWYAQDAAGNVWYLGEDTAEYEDGEVTTRSGSFEAGVDGALPGIVMPARPRPGLAYRQEYYAGEAEDRAVVLDLDSKAGVPFGHFTHVLLTKDLAPTEPKVQELKFYARGIGPVLTLDSAGGAGREELVSFTPGR